MIPDFALSLTSDGLTLLRRKAGGWLALASADLSGEAFDEMQARATTQDPAGAQVALFLPNDQVRYLELPDPGSEAERRAALERALDGATPYPVSELVLDWSLSGTTLLGAAVARESLEEAEGFLREHGFEPVLFAAIPPSGTFRGTAFFGAAAGWQGAAPERPGKVVVLPPETVEEPPEAEAPLPAQQAEPAPEAAAVVAEPSDAVAPEPPAAPATPNPTQPASAPAAEMAAERATEMAAGSEPQASQGPMPSGDAPQVQQDGQASAPSEDPRPAQSSLAFDTPPAPAPTRAPSAGAPTAATLSASASSAAVSSAAAATPAPPAPAPPAPAPPAPAPSSAAPVAPPSAPRLGAATPPGAEPPKVSAPTSPPAAPSFSSIRASRSAAPATPAAAPRLSMGRETPAPTGPDASPPAAPGPVAAAPGLRRDAKPAPAAAAGTDAPKRKRFGFGKRRDDAAPTDAAGPAAASLPETGSATTQGIKQVTPRPPVSQPLDPAGSAPVSGEARVSALRRESGGADARARRAAASLTPEEERERLTVFGARGGQAVGGKPRFLGLILTVLLLIFLAAVAAFSSVFLGDEISRLFAPSATDSSVEEMALAAPDDSEAAAEAIAADDALEAEADGMLAALELPPPASAGFDDLAAPQPNPRSPMSADEAATAYAVTGIWQRAPAPPQRPALTNAEDVYVASIDPEVQQFDAVALPDLDAGPREDQSLEPVRLPPGPGVRFELDARGLVRATPEGTVSPDGVRIFTGLPPQVPPLRTPAAEAQPPAESAAPAGDEAAGPEDSGAAAETPSEVPPADAATDPAADPAATGPAQAGLRPRGRPGDLIEQTERAVLGGVSLAELERMRPQMRPLTAQDEAQALDLPVTEQAIGASLTPLPRPRSMEAIVQEAIKQASNAPAAAPVAIAPGPSIPQNASVARSATLSNQINLREISLIGIYGKDSSRRALVRLPSGRYQKVQVGDRIDGGSIAAISEDELRYVKGGRNVVLKMPRS